MSKARIALYQFFCSLFVFVSFFGIIYLTVFDGNLAIGLVAIILPIVPILIFTILIFRLSSELKKKAPKRKTNKVKHPITIKKKIEKLGYSTQIDVLLKETNYKKIFNLWKKKFKKTHKIYDYGGNLEKGYDYYYPYPYLLKDSDKAKIENDYLSIEFNISWNRIPSEEGIAHIVKIVKTDPNNSNRYNFIMKLLKNPFHRTSLTAKQSDDIKNLIDYYIKNDNSLVHRLRLILSKEFTTDHMVYLKLITKQFLYYQCIFGIYV